MDVYDPLTRLRLRLAERRALRVPPVRLCERLDYVGWENAEGVNLLLVAPAGSPRVARRVLDLFLDGREGVEDISAGVWMVVAPQRRGRWTVSFLPPVVAASDDDAAALARRYLEALEAWERSRT
jgi:hypothetical protein